MNLLLLDDEQNSSTNKNSDLLSLKYLYFYLRLNKNSLKRYYESLNFKLDTIREKDFKNLQIPLPPLPIQQEIVTNLDRIFADPQDMKDYLAFTDKAMDLMLKDPTGKQLEDVLGGLREKRDCLNLCIRKKSQMAAIVRSVGARGFERKKLGDCLDVFKTGKNQNDLIEGNYPFYMSNGISQYANTYQFDGEYVLTARCGSLNGSQYYINGKFSRSC
jgi:type I restriction enzyme S subunit